MARRAPEYDLDVDISDLEDLVGYNLKRAYITVQNDFRAAVGQDGLSARVFSALSLTTKYPHITQSDLARMMGIERSGLVAIVDELEQRGYIQRAPVPGDRRVQALIPTDAGKKAYAVSKEVVRAHEAKLMRDFSAEERATLLSLLKKIRREDKK